MSPLVFGVQGSGQRVGDGELGTLFFRATEDTLAQTLGLG